MPPQRSLASLADLERLCAGEDGGGDVQEGVTVYVRCRPALPRRQTEDPEAMRALRLLPDGASVYIRDRFIDEKCYTFSGVFGEDSSQVAVHAAVGHPCAQAALAGASGTVLAYGQTGTGKTYTTFGPAESLGTGEEGIAPRCVRDLFDALAADEDGDWRVTLQYLQLHNDTISDLLAERQVPLALREEPIRGVRVEGCREVVAACPEHALQLFSAANAKRSVRQTEANPVSSRSHAIWNVRVYRGDNVGKVTIVDLAGSERLKKEKAVDPTRRRETQCINLSLTCLGNVIHALSDSRSPHVPFRSCKLTRILSENLCTRGVTKVVVSVTSSLADIPDTLGSLQFGLRAQCVRQSALAPPPCEQRRDRVARDVREEVKEELRVELSADTQLIQHLERHLQRFRVELCKEKQRTSELEVELAEAAGAASQEHASHRDTVDELQRVRDEVRDLERQLSAAEERASAAERSAAAADSRSRQLESELRESGANGAAGAAAAAERLQAELEAAQRSIGSLQASLDAATDSSDAAAEERLRLEAELEAARHSVGSLRSDLDAANARCEAAAEEQLRLEAELRAASLSQQPATLHAHCDESLRSAEAELEKCRGRIGLLQADLHAADARAQCAEAKNAELAGELAAALERADQAVPPDSSAEDVEALKQTVASHRAKLQEAHTALRAFARESSPLTPVARARSGSHSSLVSPPPFPCDHVEVTLDGMQEQLDAERDALARSRTEIGKLQQQRAEDRRLLADLIKERDELQRSARRPPLKQVQPAAHHHGYLSHHFACASIVHARTSE